MKHYVVTRLNMRIHDYRALLDDDIDYMLYRCALFERTCRPSLNNQTAQNFDHLILHGPDLPTIIMQRMQTYANANTHLVPIEQTDTCPRADLSRWILANADMSGGVVTTLLDSDDMLHRDYTSNIALSDSGLTLPGPVYLWHSGGVCMSPVNRPPMFSWCEGGQHRPLQTCFLRGHSTIHNEAKLITTIPYAPALMLGHACNMVTRPQPGSTDINIPALFGVDIISVTDCIRQHETPEFIAREAAIRNTREARKRANQ